jgi:uncharacterized protein YgiB involved in biofilm formation
MYRTAFAALSVVALLTGCDGDPPKQVEERLKIYASVEECREHHSAEDCDKAFAGAKEAHEQKAPRYEARSTCEDIYGHGQCVPRREGDHDIFSPLMTGFLIGHMLGSPTYQPIYVDRERRAYTYGGGGSAPVGYYGNGFIARPAGAPSTGSGIWSSGAYKPQTVTVARGGLGGSASSLPSVGAKPMANSAIVPGSVARGGFGGTASSFASSGGG